MKPEQVSLGQHTAVLSLVEEGSREEDSLNCELLPGKVVYANLFVFILLSQAFVVFDFAR